VVGNAKNCLEPLRDIACLAQDKYEIIHRNRPSKGKIIEPSLRGRGILLKRNTVLFGQNIPIYFVF
jgi:hypothetical protein